MFSWPKFALGSDVPQHHGKIGQLGLPSRLLAAESLIQKSLDVQREIVRPESNALGLEMQVSPALGSHLAESLRADSHALRLLTFQMRTSFSLIFLVVIEALFFEARLLQELILSNGTTIESP